MNGLEFIAKEFGISLAEVGRILGVSRKSVSNWTNGWKPIPQKHLVILSDYFGLKDEYFQKELTDEEKLEIQLIKIKKLNLTDSHLIETVNEEIEMEKLVRFFREQAQESEELNEILQGVKNVLERNDSAYNNALLVLVSLLKFNSDWGGDSFYGIKDKELAEDLSEVLKKHNVIEFN